MDGGEQLSDADMAPQVTLAAQVPGALLAVTLGGQVIVGAMLSPFVKFQIVQPVATPEVLRGRICQ